MGAIPPMLSGVHVHRSAMCCKTKLRKHTRAKPLPILYHSLLPNAHLDALEPDKQTLLSP